MATKVVSRTRSIGVDRVLQFFREGNEDLVRVTLQLAIEAAGQRHILIHAGPSAAPAPKPVQKRHRRTKAELAAARLNSETTATSLKNWPPAQAEVASA